MRRNTGNNANAFARKAGGTDGYQKLSSGRLIESLEPCQQVADLFDDFGTYGQSNCPEFKGIKTNIFATRFSSFLTK